VEVVSVKVDKKIKQKMKRLPNVNWSEVIRRAIMAKISDEEMKTMSVDVEMLSEAVSLTDKIRRTSKGWSSVEEIRKWRELRK